MNTITLELNNKQDLQLLIAFVRRLNGKIINVEEPISENQKSTHLEIGKVRSLETIEGLVTKNKIYPILFMKDEYFQEGEECILADNLEDYITLDCFTKEFEL